MTAELTREADGTRMAEEADELRMLRERAYGPAADIHGDEGALSRLHELEDLQRREAAGRRAASEIEVGTADGEKGAGEGAVQASGSEAADIVAADAGSDERAATADVASGAVDPATSEAGSEAAEQLGGTGAPDQDDARRPPWWRRRVPLLWIGSVLVAAALGALAAEGTEGLVAGRVAVLSVDDGADWPEKFFGERPDGGRIFDDFHGVQVLAVPQNFGNESRTECVYVIVNGPDDQQVLSTAGCAAGSFPASASLLVNPDFPDELTERFPDGTALQFVLDGSEVFVNAARGG